MRKGIGGHTLPNRGATDDWITPPEIIDALGLFSLDPSESQNQPWRCAQFGYTRNGLEEPWFGRVWLNCPYSECAKWLRKMAAHNHGTALIFARTETRMFFESVWPVASAVLFIQGRLHFHHPDGTRSKLNSGGPSVLIAYGESDAEILEGCTIPGKFVRLKQGAKEC